MVTWSVGFLMLFFRSGSDGLSLVAGRQVAAWAVCGELLTRLLTAQSRRSLNIALDFYIWERVRLAH